MLLCRSPGPGPFSSFLAGVVTAFQRQFGVVLVGGGPAGLAVLLSAHRDGRLTEMLEQGLLIVEQSTRIGKGQIGNYAINSDSTGFTFVDPLRVGSEAALHRILDTPVAQRIAAAGPNAVPLRDVGELMELIGEALHAIIDTHPNSAVITSCTADSAQMLTDGSWQLLATHASGRTHSFQAKRLILATGATQPEAKLRKEFVAGMPVVEQWGDRLMQSGDVLGVGGLDKVAQLLRGKSRPTVAILGGSTSAMATAHALLHRLPEIQFGEGGVTLFHRRKLRVYYTSVDEALAEGYTEFGTADLCPLTNRVYRLAGLRLDSRELLMQVRGIGGRAPEPRMKMHQLLPDDADAVRLIDSADLVVAALGYRPNALPILDESGARISLFADDSPSAPLVDKLCRVLDGRGQPIAGVYGIGLAAGFVPYGKLGGEPSFTGQANGLWLWQTDVGNIIVNAVLPVAAATRLPRNHGGHASSPVVGTGV
jgi:hypothetical protein